MDDQSDGIVDSEVFGGLILSVKEWSYAEVAFIEGGFVSSVPIDYMAEHVGTVREALHFNPIGWHWRRWENGVLHLIKPIKGTVNDS